MNSSTSTSVIISDKAQGLSSSDVSVCSSSMPLQGQKPRAHVAVLIGALHQLQVYFAFRSRTAVTIHALGFVVSYLCRLGLPSFATSQNELIGISSVHLEERSSHSRPRRKSWICAIVNFHKVAASSSFLKLRSNLSCRSSPSLLDFHSSLTMAHIASTNKELRRGL